MLEVSYLAFIYSKVSIIDTNNFLLNNIFSKVKSDDLTVKNARLVRKWK